jgi:hypothetical protein
MAGETPDYAITQDLLRYIKTAGPVHINADYPDLRAPIAPAAAARPRSAPVRLTLTPTIILDWRRFTKGAGVRTSLCA